MGKKTYACSPRYRIYPTEQQRQQIDATLDAVRFVYNHFLAIAKEQYQNTGEFPDWLEMQAQLPALKEEHPWLRAAPASALQVAVQHLGRTFQNFNRRKAQGLNPGKLRFKTCNDYTQSYRSSGGSNRIVITGERVKLSKQRNIRICCTPVINGRIVAATVTREGRDRYYISFCYEQEYLSPLPPMNNAVGIDLGLHTLVAKSDGEKLEAHFPDSCPPRLERLYKRLERQTNGSNRWWKTYHQIRRLRKKIHNQRQDVINKISAELVHQYDVICIESLHQRAMEAEDKYQYMRHAIRNSGWGEFRRQLKYKCEKYGRQLVAVDRYYPSSQLCSVCGHRWAGTKDLQIREWTCPVCGARHDRDINAAKNILHEGLRLLEQTKAA